MASPVSNPLADVMIQRPGVGEARSFRGVSGANLAAAKSAAQPGDTVYVGPGTWNVKNLLKDGVNWIFAPGAMVNYTGSAAGGIFDDGPNGANGPVACAIDGAGSFTNSTTDTSVPNHTVSVTNAGSNVTLRCAALDNAAFAGNTINHHGGKLTVHCPLIDAHAANGNAYYWENGESHVNAGRVMKSGGSAGWCVYCLGVGTMTGDAYVRADQIYNATSGLGGAITSGGSATGNAARAWVYCPKIEAALGGQAVSTSGTTLLYVSSEKIFGQQAVNGGTYYVFAQKASTHDAAQLYTQAAGKAYVHVDEWDDSSGSAAPPSVMEVDGGTCYLSLKSLVRVTAGDGITVTGGTLRATAGLVSTLGGSHDLAQSGGTLAEYGLGYATSTGAITHGLSTSQVGEGGNLYFTNARASAAAPVQSVAGKTGAVALAAADVGITLTASTSTLASTYTLTTIYGNVGVAVTLGPAGKYLILANVRTYGGNSANGSNTALRLYDQTAGGAVPNSETQTYNNASAFQAISASISMEYTTTVANTVIQLQGVVDAAGTGAVVGSDGNGRTRMTVLGPLPA